jgi:signal transduction histidine kinase/ligand-binding sensor domain-containing protein
MVRTKRRSVRAQQVLIAISLFVWVSVVPPKFLGEAGSEHLLLTQLDHKVWTIRDGAPREVMGIAQDHDGSLWLVGQKGVYQFDGLRFKEFHAAAGGADLPSGGYFSVMVTRNGDVWIGSRLHGIARIRSGRVSFFDEHDGFPPNRVSRIIEGPDGSIWAVVHERLMVFNGINWTDGGAAGGISKEAVRDVFFDHNGTQWVSTGRFICYRPRGHQEFSRTDINLDGGNDTSNFVESMNGELWFASIRPNPISSELRQLDPTGHVEVTSHGAIHLPFEVYMITVAMDGSLWVTGTELNRFDSVTTGGKQKLSRERFGSAEGLTSPGTRAIFQDRNGDMWLSTPKGIERFQEPVLIKYVDRPLSNELGIGLARDSQGTIWIGSEKAPILSVRSGETREHGPPLSKATNLFADSRGAIWIKTYEGVVREAHDHLMKVRLPTGVPTYALRQFFEVEPGELDVSFAAEGSFGTFHFHNGKWVKLDMPDQPKETPLSFFVDRQRRVWIGYINGKVGMVDNTTGSVFPVGRDAELGSIQTFLETSEGLLCGGLNGIAILRGNHFEVLETAIPGAITGTSGIVQAKNGDLWLNGFHGVSKVAYSDFRASVSHGTPMATQLYTQTEITGPAAGCCFPSAVTDASGRIWFNTSGVIAYVDPAHMPHNTLPPTLAIAAVEEDGKPVGERNQIRAGTSTVRIPYFGVNLFAPEKVKYLYWLHGVDKTWQDVGRRTEAVYTHLSPGRYLFAVKATNGEGVWSEPVTASFTVLPTFYQTAWFAALCATAVIMLLWLGLTARVRYVTAGIKQRAEERADERIRIARELHDTLLQGVQGLLLNFHVAAQKVAADHESKEALEKALATADRIIVEGRNRVNRLRSENLTDAELKSLIEGVADNLNSIAAIDCAVERKGGRAALQNHVVDEIFCIAREALTNAYRHSGASQIVVELNYQKREFRMICRDNGRGFDSTEFLTGPTNGHWGLRGMAERAEKMGGSFSCNSSVTGGTEIHLTVPARLAYQRQGPFGLLRKGSAA